MSESLPETDFMRIGGRRVNPPRTPHGIIERFDNPSLTATDVQRSTVSAIRLSVRAAPA